MKHRFPILVLALTLLPLYAAADDRVERHYRYDATEIDELRLDFSVGTMTIEPATGTELTVDLVIKSEDGTRWIPFMGGKADVSDMELRESRRGRHLWLQFDEKDVTTEWVVRIPPIAGLEIDAGVGTIDGELPDLPADIDLGVGSIDLILTTAAVGPVDLSAGVGETRLVGADRTETRRVLVSSESSSQGSTGHPVRIEVGVGEAVLEVRAP